MIPVREVWIAVDADGIPSGPAYSDEESAAATAAALDQNVPQYGPHRVQQYVVEDRLAFIHQWYAARWERLNQLVREEATEEFKQRWFSTMANGTADWHEPPTYAQLLNTKQHQIDRMAHHIAGLHQLLGIRPSTGPRAEVEQHAERVLKDVMEASKENSAANAKLEEEVAELKAGGKLLSERNTVYFDSARAHAEENQRLTVELSAVQRALEAVCTTFPKDTDIRFVMSAIIGVIEHEDGPTVVQYIGQLERLLKEARAHAGEDVPKPAGD